MGLTNSEIHTLIVIERATASVSVVATFILLSTFIFIKSFRTLTNTLIFYASFANLFANVAALIGGSALGNLDGALCQFQAFLLEMFMQSDPLWSCAMAVNVYLVFFRRYDAARLKKLYWYYGILCYGLPFIPAMFCLFYRTKEKGKMYGNATLWCWIDNKWAPVRIYSYYAPIWVAILTTFIIYVRVGVEVFQKRSELHNAAYDANCTSATMSSSDRDKKSTSLPPLVPFSGLRTTEIKVTTDPWTQTTSSHQYSHSPSQSFAARPEKTPSSHDLYSITISSPPASSTTYPQIIRFPPVQTHHTTSPSPSPYQTTTTIPTTLPKRLSPTDKIKWAYTRCALLFAISILITWVPASVNRVYGLRYPTRPSFALNIGSAILGDLWGLVEGVEREDRIEEDEDAN
ncbi:hypothetical protein IFR04_004089 [Cadophora malorum]|uniref:G-protein coupled receptors family 2 profile 2 domain-containing protein n=1 Tax=Cadophora malorum TaxID=108018 RepID=A0A8H7WD95_9HELO|nr:hypothetical protein IFR04_004089 [Cadophora malorum]